MFGDVEAIATAMVVALPTSHPYDQLVGPFYDTAGLTKWLGVSRQSVNKNIGAGTTLACKLDDGQWVYPTWQFTSEGSVYPQLITLWKTLRYAADPWTCAVWLRTAQSALGGRSAVDWVTGGLPVEEPHALARADVERWSM